MERMVATIAAALAALSICAPAPDPTPRGNGGEPQFKGSSHPIEGQIRDRIVGSSWHPGCPVHISKLRLLELRHWGFDHDVHRGKLVVHRAEDKAILRVMERLFKRRFPIRKMALIDRYDASDHRSMNDDNTSAFNCRFVAGTSRWSNHAYGRAIDVNPIENPYVSGSHVSPPAGKPFADRSRDAKGMIHDGDVVVRAFARKAGWEWGGDWSGGTRDYQHFSANGS